ncbi:MAG: DUF3574 domain-containing protein [Gammaproteobacteria bacterium]
MPIKRPRRYPITPRSRRTTTTLKRYAKAPLAGEPFARTELIFGLSKSDGSTISEFHFRRFLRETVTPLFPDGLTLTLQKIRLFGGSRGFQSRQVMQQFLLDRLIG